MYKMGIKKQTYYATPCRDAFPAVLITSLELLKEHLARALCMVHPGFREGVCQGKKC